MDNNCHKPRHSIPLERTMSLRSEPHGLVGVGAPPLRGMNVFLLFCFRFFAGFLLFRCLWLLPHCLSRRRLTARCVKHISWLSKDSREAFCCYVISGISGIFGSIGLRIVTSEHLSTIPPQPATLTTGATTKVLKYERSKHIEPRSWDIYVASTAISVNLVDAVPGNSHRGVDKFDTLFPRNRMGCIFQIFQAVLLRVRISASRSFTVDSPPILFCPER